MFEPLRNGKLQGVGIDEGEFKSAVQQYYQAVGWDENGVPTPGKIAELSLAWIMEGAGV